MGNWAGTTIALRDSLSGYQPREVITCLRFAPRWPGGGTNPAYGNWRERGPRQAAVLLLVVGRPSGLHLILTERHAGLRQHAGEIALPGGRVDKTDDSLLEAALREAREEVGVPAEAIEVLAQLDPVYVPPSNFVVTPFVGLLDAAVALRANDPEVQAIIEAPLGVLFDAACAGEMNDEAGRLIEYYEVAGHRVWGATARILNNLAEALGLECDASHQR